MNSTDMASYMAKRRATRRLKLIEMSGGSCEICGSIENLEFNHKDATKKVFGLSGAGLDKAWIKIVEEWEKCELLCQLHHRQHTDNLYSDRVLTVWNTDGQILPEHGTIKMYQNQSCRCVDCKYAKKLYRNKKIEYLHEPVYSSVTQLGRV